MKKQLMTLAAMLAFVGSVFGQGQVTMGNNAGSLIRIGIPYDPAATPVAIGTMSFQLYYGVAGTPEGNLLALSTIAGTSTVIAGRIANTVIDVPLAPGSAATFQIWAWQNTFTSYALAAAGGGLVGKSALFNATTSGAGPPPPLPTALAGTYPGFGVAAVPEPSMLVLAGLGVASLLLFRRRK
jgi:hypothetical protein